MAKSRSQSLRLDNPREVRAGCCRKGTGRGFGQEKQKERGMTAWGWSSQRTLCTEKVALTQWVGDRWDWERLRNA